MRNINVNACLRMVAIAVVALVMPQLQAQDDTSFSLFDEPVAPVAEKVQFAFKTTKVVNLQSTELVDPGVFDFKMSHRFGAMNGGAAAFNNEDVVNAFGFDVATIRFGGEYGVNENLMVGLGRYNVKSEKGVDAFSWVISPTVVRSGMNTRYDGASESFVSSGTDRTQFALGMGFRNKLSMRTSLNMEYIPILNGNGDFYNSFSVGFDVETGGHVFQFDFTNSVGMNESMFITRTNDRWGAAGVRLGFNLHRVFTVVER